MAGTQGLRDLSWGPKAWGWANRPSGFQGENVFQTLCSSGDIWGWKLFGAFSLCGALKGKENPNFGMAKRRRQKRPCCGGPQQVDRQMVTAPGPGQLGDMGRAGRWTDMWSRLLSLVALGTWDMGAGGQLWSWFLGWVSSGMWDERAREQCGQPAEHLSHGALTPPKRRYDLTADFLSCCSRVCSQNRPHISVS